jgi:predicted ATP-grasp superfamily ATP-dependent carboligase
VRALIVEDGFQRGSLAAARALGRAGWDVGIAAETAVGFASMSRWTSETHIVPGPAMDPDGFVAGVAAAVTACGYDVVFPAGDGQLLALSRQRTRIEAVFPYADHATVVRAHDKLELAAAATRAGLNVPDDSGTGPFIVKPRLTVAPGVERLRAVAAPDRAAAERAAEELRAAGGEPAIQRAVPGRLVALVVVVDREGRLVARVQQVASAVWPPLTGGSVRAETTVVDEELAAGVHRLLRDLGWFGLGQVQFVRADDGAAFLIDFNGRFYGSMALALAAGPNLPAIWAALATGRDAPAGGDSRPGVRYQWLEADLRRIGPSALRHAFRASHGLWRLDDPQPAGRHAIRLAGRLLRKAAT